MWIDIKETHARGWLVWDNQDGTYWAFNWEIWRTNEDELNYISFKSSHTVIAQEEHPTIFSKYALSGRERRGTMSYEWRDMTYDQAKHLWDLIRQNPIPMVMRVVI